MNFTSSLVFHRAALYSWSALCVFCWSLKPHVARAWNNDGSHVCLLDKRSDMAVNIRQEDSIRLLTMDVHIQHVRTFLVKSSAVFGH